MMDLTYSGKTTEYIMILLLLITVFAIFPWDARAQRMTDVKISLELDHATLKDVIEIIEALTPFTFVAKAEDVEKEKDISLNAKNKSLTSLLLLILKDRGLYYKQVGTHIILKKDLLKKIVSTAPY
ncbi:hypothetical protein ACX0G9_05410 [Flavitalea flava]